MKKLLLILVLIGSYQYVMAADVLRYLNSDSTAGGDGTTNAITGANRAYATMAEWETAEDGASSSGDDHYLVCEGTTPDAGGAFSIAGWAAGVSSIVIYGSTAQAQGAHLGYYSTNTYRQEPATYTNDVIDIGEDFPITFRRLQFRQAENNSGVAFFDAEYGATGDDLRIDGCIFNATGDTSNQHGIISLKENRTLQLSLLLV